MRAQTSRPTAMPTRTDGDLPPATTDARTRGERTSDMSGIAPLGRGATGATRHVINATSVLVHPGLGRAVLSGSAQRAVEVAFGCTDLEYGLNTGQRGRRGRETVAALLAAVPTAGAAYVVNSNPAALVLAATVLAPGRELVISQRELYEIRDGFRLPELLTSTGARLCPVGTADGAVLDDYRQAVWSGTGCVLTLVPARGGSDGACGRPDVTALAGLRVPVIADISPGLLRPEPALSGEPDAETALRQGATLATASGDKLLGWAADRAADRRPGRHRAGATAPARPCDVGGQTGPRRPVRDHRRRRYPHARCRSDGSQRLESPRQVVDWRTAGRGSRRRTGRVPRHGAR